MNEASLRDWLALSEGSLGVEMATGKQLIPQMAVYFNKARPRLGNATGAPGFTRSWGNAGAGQVASAWRGSCGFAGWPHGAAAGFGSRRRREQEAVAT